MTEPRRMICYDEDNRRFQVRAAGIALRDGKVLVHRSVRDDFWALPGGRVEYGETSAQTLVREMHEELGCAVSVERLLFTCETIFTFDGRDHHEIGFYHLMTVPDDFGLGEGICHRVRDGDADLEFKWVKTDLATLTAEPLVPQVMLEHLATPPSAPLHLLDVARETA